MERMRFRPFALGLMALAGLALLPVASRDAQAGAAPAPPGETLEAGLPHMKVLPALLPNSKENTNAVAQNNGSAPSTIAMDIYTPAGVLVQGASQVFTSVPVGATRVFIQALNTGLAPGFRGVGVISSDQPFDAILARDIENNSTFAKSYSLHNAYATGGSLVTLPYISNNLAGLFSTRFAIANTGASVACVTIAYAFDGGGGFTDNGPGGSGCGAGYPIPVGGQVSFAPSAIDTALAMPGATAGRLMSATVTSTGSTVTVGVDAFVNGQLKLGSYDGFIVGGAADDIGTTLSIPVAAKTSDGFYTQILLSNTNNTAASATITYRDQATGQTYPVNVNVPANGTANHSVYSDGIVPVGFVGAATVTSDQPIAAVLFRIKMTSAGSFVDEPLYTAVNGVPEDLASTEARFPLIFRRAYGNNASCDGSGTSCGYNTWVAVIVPGGGEANLQIQAVNDTSNTAPNCQAAATYNTNMTIEGSFIIYQNANSANGFGQNPSCFWGGMVITSDVPIIAIANATNDLSVGDNDGVYNAFGD